MPAPRNLTEPYIRSLKPAPAGQRYAIADAVVPGLKIRVCHSACNFDPLSRGIGVQN